MKLNGFLLTSVAFPLKSIILFNETFQIMLNLFGIFALFICKFYNVCEIGNVKL